MVYFVIVDVIKILFLHHNIKLQFRYHVTIEFTFTGICAFDRLFLQENHLHS